MSLLSQEMLTKTLLHQKKPSIKQGLPVNKKTLLATAFISMVLMLAVTGTSLFNVGRANPNPFGPPEIVTNIGIPDSETKPPTVSITAPTNDTSHILNNVSFVYNVGIGDSETASVRFLWDIQIEADFLPKRIIAYAFYADEDPYTTEPTITEFSKTLNLTGIPEGKHSLIVHARERGAYERYDYVSGFITKVYVTNFLIEGSSSVVFTVDLKPPKISVLSIENKTYNAANVPLNFTVNEPVSQITYCLDGQEKITILGNTTLTNLPYGKHNVTVYATDNAGNTGASETITFTIAKPELFPTTIVAAVSGTSVAIIGVGLLFYFKKRNH